MQLFFLMKGEKDRSVSARHYFPGLANLCIKTMKLATFCMLALGLQVRADVYSQRITLSQHNSTLEKVFRVIKKQSGYDFLCTMEQLHNTRNIDINVKNASLENVLEHCFREQPLTYRIINKTIVVERKVDLVSATSPVVTEVSGNVTDLATGKPLQGVTVQIKGTTQGAITDENGHFKLTVPDGAVLIISYLGFNRQEVTVKGQVELNVRLEASNAGLNELVVVGYGVQKKGTLTGAISNLVADEITTTTHSSLAQSLEGKIPGLQIRQNTGEPGDFNTMINIRGFGSPLFVIDGIARDGAVEFQKLNPSDIESISILKDGAAAIYGLNAANGVVIVTTKKGTSGKTKFNYGYVTGMQRPTNVPAMTNAAQYMEMMNEANINAGAGPILSKEELAKYQQGLPGYGSTDWYAETFKKFATQSQHNLSAQGGNDKVNYYLSLGLQNDEGLLKSGDMNYKKYTFRSNISAQLLKNLVADLRLSGMTDKQSKPGTDFFTIFKQTRTTLPTESVYANGNPLYPAMVLPLDNPVMLSNADYTGYNQVKNKSFQSVIGLTYTAPFLKGLKIKGTASYDSNDQLGKSLVKTYRVFTYDKETNTYTPFLKNNPAKISNTNYDYNSVNLQSQLLYNTTIARNHNVDATIVYEQRETGSRYSYLSRQYNFYTNDQLDQASPNVQQTAGNEGETANKSYLGRLNYNFKNKYLLEFAGRFDGSYRYSPNKRWGFFPVMSGGWILSEENFIKNTLPAISYLKIRGSYGIVGQDNSANAFQYVQGFSTSGGAGYEFSDGTYLDGVASPPIINESLTWYKSNISNIGLEASLFKGMLTFEGDVFQRDRSGLLAYRNVSLPNTFGGTLPQENLNSDRIVGFDISVGHARKIGNFSYGIKGNFSFSRTMARHVEGSNFRSSMEKWKNGTEGRWTDILWGYKVAGQFQNQEEIFYAPIQDGNLGNIKELPGDFRYVDVNGDGIIDSNDMLPLFRNGDPKYYYGLILNAEWKGFDLNMVMQGSGKYTLRFGQTYAGPFNFNGNSPEFFYDRWHQVDPYNPNSEWVPGKWPATRYEANRGAMGLESEIWRKDASYLRMKSIMLGYTIHSPFMMRTGIKNIRVYANAHNLFTFAGSFVRQFDPEKIEGNYSGGYTYPLTKSYNVGVDVTF
ncbi:TonB-dependent receptor [Chitinophaga sp. 30R24]|uniref:TonB-dependent receptor n=1 Tax=Chitinophaga sp. 30R24 TaxID=3248838 RepID=UPI003B9053FE